MPRPVSPRDLERVRGQKTHGFMYLAVDGDRFITIIGHDAEPHYRQNLTACESAVLSWRKPEAGG
jgi:hypothetical protein